MADLFDSIRKTWIKAIEVVGDTATNLADSAKNKVNEMNLSSSRKEFISQCGEMAYQLWLDGKSFPEELVKQFEEIQSFDKQLEEILTQRQAEEAAKKEEEKKEEAKKEEIPYMDDEDLVRKTKEVLEKTPDSEESSPLQEENTPQQERPLEDSKSFSQPDPSSQSHSEEE